MKEKKVGYENYVTLRSWEMPGDGGSCDGPRSAVITFGADPVQMTQEVFALAEEKSNGRDSCW